MIKEEGEGVQGVSVSGCQWASGSRNLCYHAIGLLGDGEETRSDVYSMISRVLRLYQSGSRDVTVLQQFCYRMEGTRRRVLPQVRLCGRIWLQSASASIEGMGEGWCSSQDNNSDESRVQHLSHWRHMSPRDIEYECPRSKS